MNRCVAHPISEAKMTVSRRKFLRGAAGTTALVAAPAIVSRAWAADTVKVGVILDQSGGLDIYGQPMVDTVHLAAKEGQPKHQ